MLGAEKDGVGEEKGYKLPELLHCYVTVFVLRSFIDGAMQVGEIEKEALGREVEPREEIGTLEGYLHPRPYKWLPPCPYIKWGPTTGFSAAALERRHTAALLHAGAPRICRPAENPVVERMEASTPATETTEDREQRGLTSVVDLHI